MIIFKVRLIISMPCKKRNAKIDFSCIDKKVSTKDIHLVYTINTNSWVKLSYAGELIGLKNQKSSP